jgi:hypothetical protein
MATASDDTYWIRIDRASEAELRRGMAAARASLDADGIVDPEPMFHALFKEEGQEMGNKGFLNGEERRLIRCWNRANDAAVRACCGAWKAPPASACLSIAKVVRESEARHEEWRKVIPPENFVELPDTGPHYDLTEPAPLELALEDA